jgi:CheY-like chemotaxis protein
VVTAVICDDDSILRGTLSGICEDVGLEVVAETDTGSSALELVRRFNVDVLVLDRALPDISGETVIETLREEPTCPAIVVFSAYAAETDHLITLGARAIVEKPDFERLEQVLTATLVALEDEADRARRERRHASREVDEAPELALTSAGLAAADDLLVTASHTQPGDSVLVVAMGLGADTGSGPDIGPLLRSAVRVQDMVHERVGLHGYVAVLRGGDESAAAAVWRRFLALAEGAGVEARLHGAWRQVDPLGTMAALERAEEALIASLHGDPGLQPA